MFARLIAVSLVLVANGTEAQTDNRYFNPQLYPWCIEAIKALDGERANFTEGYICTSTIDAYRLGFHIAVSSIQNESSRKIITSRFFGCLPEMNNLSFIRILMDGMKENPVTFSDSYPMAIMKVFTKKFPCRKAN